MAALTESSTLAVPGAPPAPPEDRIAALDGVRGVAIVLVVIFHVFKMAPAAIDPTHSSFHPLDQAVDFVTVSFFCGVELFFVLSGFLITGILLDSRGKPGYFRNFYARRTLRIFPLYYGVLAVVLLLIPALCMLAGRGVPYAGLYAKLQENQFYLWTYTSNFLRGEGDHEFPGMSHFWTLAIEEQFYLVWPLCVFLVAPRRMLPFCLSLVVAAFGLRAAMYYAGLEAPVIRQFTPARVDTLLLGAAAAVVIREPALMKRITPWLGTIVAVCLASLLAIALYEGKFGGGKPTVVVYGYSILSILFAAWILWVMSGANRAASATPLLETAWLQTIGKYSYALYVFHWPIARVVHELFTRKDWKLYPEYASSSIPDAAIALAIVSTLTFVAAWLSWHLYEVHWLKLKRYFAYHKPASSTAPPQPVVVATPALPALTTASSE